MGDATSISARINSLTTSDGGTVQVPHSGVFLLVGPNNAGKSQSLRDIMGALSTPDHRGKAVTDVQLEKSGSPDDFAAWLDSNVPFVIDEAGQEARHVTVWGRVSDLNSISGTWASPALHNIADLFVFHANASSRLDGGSAVGNINFRREPATLPLQRAYLDPDLERSLREASEAAFGVSVCVDRFAGSVICLRVGDVPTAEYLEGVPKAEYLDALARMPVLEEQGDGMRSYLGLLLHILGGKHQITLLDEPEAFLHPPQAQLLGRTLAERAKGSQQLFMATHSADVVQGALNSSADVTIARITREQEVNHVSVLDPAQVAQLWSDPLLRYSNLLDGLFHDAVVLCEGDADCKYYSSVLDSVSSREGLGLEGKAPQMLFSHVGGKQRLASVVASLQAISIPVVVISDFDILNDRDTLSKTVAALGGDFAAMERDWNVVNGNLASSVKPVSKVALKEVLEAELEKMGPQVDKSAANRLRGLIRVDSGWDLVKRSGMAAVPAGDAHSSASTLLESLASVGLLVVPVGEIERFVPAVSGHGPSWVTQVLEQGLHDDESLREPRDFVRRVIRTAANKAGF